MAFCNFSFWFAFYLKNNRKIDMGAVNTTFGCITIATVEMKTAKFSAQTLTHSGRLSGIAMWSGN
jgi:hypothetical protein